jgi:transcriptional regulator with XRE-family HTH domain
LAGWVAVIADEEAFYRALGERIAELRRKQNLTQQQLADALGLSQRTVGHYEVGRIRVQVYMLPELSDCLRVSISELIDPVRKALSRRKPSRRSAERSG